MSEFIVSIAKGSWPNLASNIEQTLVNSRRIPVGNYMFKVNDRNTRTRCEIYSRLTTDTRKTPLTKWLSVRLPTEWFWVRVQLQSIIEYKQWHPIHQKKLKATSSP